jgi:alpha-L-fucosidase
MLRQVTAGGGNLLLNIGPEPDGSVPPEATRRLLSVGKWLARNAEAVYGKTDSTEGCFERNPLGGWTRKGKSAYFWCERWPGNEITLGGFRSKLKRATLLASGKPLRFEQKGQRLTLRGLPKSNPDRIANITIIKMDFASLPKQKLGTGCVIV